MWACVCICPLSPRTAGVPPACQADFSYAPDKDMGVGGDLHVPQEGHRRSLPPPTPETVLSLWSRFSGVGAESVETTSRKHLAPGLRINSLVLTLTWVPPSQCSVSVRRSLGFRAGHWIYPSHLVNPFLLYFCLFFFFHVCIS